MAMAKRKKAAKKTSAMTDAGDIVESAEEDRIATSNLSLHELFQQQAMQMLDQADMSEEQKQVILVAMSCPCCGAGGMSFTAKLKR
jgi:hypothetical protein